MELDAVFWHRGDVEAAEMELWPGFCFKLKILKKKFIKVALFKMIKSVIHSVMGLTKWRHGLFIPLIKVYNTKGKKR